MLRTMPMPPGGGPFRRILVTSLGDPGRAGHAAPRSASGRLRFVRSVGNTRPDRVAEPGETTGGVADRAGRDGL